jgi:hypothetical protein
MNSQTEELVSRMRELETSLPRETDVEYSEEGFADLYWDRVEGIRHDGSVVLTLGDRERVGAAGFVNGAYRLVCIDSAHAEDEILGAVSSARAARDVIVALIRDGLDAAVAAFNDADGVRAGEVN